MIRYIRESYWGQVFVLRGGIVTSLALPISAYCFYCMIVFGLGCLYNIEFVLSDDRSSMGIISHCVSFLLVFRLHQCHGRYEHAATLCSEFFADLKHIVALICAYSYVDSGSKDDKHNPELLLATQVHTARLVIAIGVSLKFHCRIAENALLGGKLSAEKVPLVIFDYIRIKGLLCSREESLLRAACALKEANEAEDKFSFHVSLAYQGRQDSRATSEDVSSDLRPTGCEDDSGGVALPVMLMQFLRNHMREAVRHKIVVERMMSLVEMDLKSIGSAFSQLDQLIVMPLPLAYLQHCKLIFLSFVLVYPLTLDTFEGFWANVISPTMIFMALFGMEVLADAMENPLGDDGLDMNVMEMIHELELRCQRCFNVSVAHGDQLLEESEELLAGVEFPGQQPKQLRRLSRSKSSDRRTSSSSRRSSGTIREDTATSAVHDYNRNHIDLMTVGEPVEIPWAESVFRRFSHMSWLEDSTCFQATGYRNFKEIFPEHKSMITHFLCLSMRNKIMNGICKDMAKEMSPEAYYQDYMKQLQWDEEVWNESTDEPGMGAEDDSEDGDAAETGRPPCDDEQSFAPKMSSGFRQQALRPRHGSQLFTRYHDAFASRKTSSTVRPRPPDLQPPRPIPKPQGPLLETQEAEDPLLETQDPETAPILRTPTKL